MKHAAYSSEKAMYPEVCRWLREVLQSRFPRAEIQVADTSQMVLSNFLEREGLTDLFPDYQTYEINVDVTAIIKRKTPALAFVECKLTTLTLRDTSQLLGYSKVAQPIYSIIVSPAGISKALSLLLKNFHRYDILEYGETKRLRLATWDPIRKTIDPATVIPPGDYY